MINKYISMVLIVFSLLAVSGCGGEGDKIVITDVWASPGIEKGNAGTFFILENSTSVDDRLISAESDITQTVEIHLSSMEEGVMKMSPQEFVAVPAKSKVEFKPGGYHLMLIGLERTMQIGDEFNITLVFENAGTLNLPVTVREP